MSWAVTTYTCRRCDVEMTDVSTWGAREYVMPNGVRIPMEWSIAWCFACDGIRAAELLDVKRLIDELSFAKSDLSAFGPRPSPDHNPQAFADWAHLAGIVEDARDALRVFVDRDKPLHCLSCGSEHFMPCAEEIDGSGRLVHGPCGTEFTTSEDGFRLALKQTITAYTINGDLVEQVAVSGYSMPDRENYEDRVTSNAKIRGLWTPVKPLVQPTRRPWWPDVWQHTAK